MRNLGTPALITEVGQNIFDIANIFGEPIKAGIQVNNAEAARRLREFSETGEIALVLLDEAGNLHFTKSSMAVIKP